MEEHRSIYFFHNVWMILIKKRREEKKRTHIEKKQGELIASFNAE
jgi:hypothetical protein